MLLKSRKRARGAKSALDDGDDEDVEELVVEGKKHAGVSARKAQIRAVNERLKLAERQAGEHAERALAEAREQGMEEAFQYDQGFEEFSSTAKQKKKDEQEAELSQEPKQSLYIGRLLEAARQRDLQHEIAFEKAKRREREAEIEGTVGVSSSEVFVTFAYKKRLEERAEFEQSEQAREAEESKRAGQGMGGFYSNLMGSMTSTAQSAPEKPTHAPASAESAMESISVPVATETVAIAKVARTRKAESASEPTPSESEPRPRVAPRSLLSPGYLDSARKRAIQRATNRGARFISRFIST